MICKYHVRFLSGRLRSYPLINYFGFFFLKHSYNTYYKLLDKGLLEIFFFNGVSSFILRVSFNILKQQNGFLYSLFCLNLLCFLFFCFLLFLF